ncbi:MAG: T9SS type A sorting domain-containing protein [Bacteroidota bacterium]
MKTTRILSYVFALMLFGGNVYSQKFAPIGSKWTYQSLGLGSSVMGFPVAYQFRTEKDTTIDNRYCTVITGYNLYEDGRWEPIGSEIVAASETGDTVYIYFKDSFRIIYDFTAEVGDTIAVINEKFGGLFRQSFIQNDRFVYKIDSISSILLNADTLLIQYVSYLSPPADLTPEWGFGDGLDIASNTPGRIFEGIGALSRAAPLGTSSDISYLPEGMPSYLNCYEDENSYYQLGDLDCDALIALTDQTPCEVEAGPDQDVCLHKADSLPRLNGLLLTDNVVSWRWSTKDLSIGSVKVTASTILEDTTLLSPKILGSPHRTTTYYLEGLTAEGAVCRDSTTVKESRWSFLAIDKRTVKTPEDTIQLWISAQSNWPHIKYEWSPNFAISDTTVEKPLVWNDTSTFYDLTITNSLGCSAKDGTFSVFVNQGGSMDTTTAENEYSPLVLENATWILFHSYEDYTITDYTAYKIKGDTTINNTPYKKVYFYELEKIGADKYQIVKQQFAGYLREDRIARKVYGRIFVVQSEDCLTDSTEQLLFDFSKKVGDNFEDCYLNEADSTESRLITKDTIVDIFGQHRRVFMNSGKIELIEGIGYDEGLFVQPTDLIHVAFGNGIQSYCIGDNFSCNLLTSTSDPLTQKVDIFPNPTTNQLNLQFEQIFNGQIELHSLAGQTVYQIQLQSTKHKIEVTNLPTGIYFLHLRAEEGYLVQKVIVQ